MKRINLACQFQEEGHRTALFSLDLVNLACIVMDVEYMWILRQEKIVNLGYYFPYFINWSVSKFSRRRGDGVKEGDGGDR